MSIKLAIAATALALSPAPALAAEEADAVQVEYGDLDLGNDKDLARLQRRIHTAARQVCGDVPRELAFREKTIACRQQALADAIAQVQPALAAAGRSEVSIAQSSARSAR